MLRLALRPRWIVGHLLVLCVAVTCVRLGSWQLHRLDEKRDRIRLVDDAQALAPVPVEDLLAPGDPVTGPSADAVAFRSVTVTGTYDLDHEVLIRNRPYAETNGNDVVTPLVLGDGSAVLVSRGWVPYDAPPERPLPGSEPPTGTVEVTGVLQRTEADGALAAVDAPDGDLGTVNRLDVEAISAKLPYPVLPLYVQLATQAPGDPTRYPFPVEVEEPDEGPHLSYAVQWFTFATLALLIWPLVVRKAAGRSGTGADAAARPPAPDEPRAVPPPTPVGGRPRGPS